jgi:AraC-like DNA-binding protein
MLKFYRNAAFGTLSLVVLTLLIMYIGFIQSRLSLSLLPERSPDLLWVSGIEPKNSSINKTQIQLKDETKILEYDFNLRRDPETPYPYAHYGMYFVDQKQEFLQVDLRAYQGVTFKIQCDPKNVLLFGILSFDNKATKLDYLPSRRISYSAFSCNNNWVNVFIDFDRLITPPWWLESNGLELSDTGYRLDQALGILWLNSSQSPIDTQSHIKITDVKLVGTNTRFIYGAIVLSLLLWVIFIVWLIRRYTTALTTDTQEKIRLIQPLIAYQKLSIEPQKDKEKSSLLRYIATEYANPDLSLEMAAATLGINRNKINDLLKDELGLTFIAYLNKLRLTEAARLLAENDEANVSEIAHLVGYNNASYFNKLFKLEYGCAPKTFKDVCQQKNPGDLNSDE